MIKKYFLFICLLLLSHYTHSWAQSAKSDSLYSIGFELYNEGKYDKAIPYFKESYALDCIEMDSLSLRKDYSAAWVAYCYYKIGNIDEARKYNNVSYKSKPLDRRLTVKIDSLSAEVERDFMNRCFTSALRKAEEIDRLESSICEPNSFFHVGTYLGKSKCYVALQKLDSAYYYTQKVHEIEKVYFEELDTLYLGTLGDLFYLSLNLHQYEAAESYNAEIVKIWQSHFDSGHYLNAETHYQKILLYLYQRDWVKAHEALPEYLDILSHCFGNDLEAYRSTIYTIRSNFEMCGRFDDVKIIDSHHVEATQSKQTDNPREQFNTMILQYANAIQSKDSLSGSGIERDIIQLLSQYPTDSLKEQRALLACVQTMHYMAKGDFPEAQNVFLQFQKDSLEQYLDENNGYYVAYISAKASICISLGDFEGGISAYTKLIEKIDTFQLRQDPSVLAQLACVHAMAGHYQQARELTQKAIKDYKQYVVDIGASFRLDVDTMKVRQIVDVIESYISNSVALPDSATYMLREIKSNYILLKSSLLTNVRRYQIELDYYQCFADYALELIRMQKYVEAQNVMNNYLSEWHNCYDTIDPKSDNEDDVFDIMLGQLVLEEALEFRSKFCFEKGDNAGVKAHQDYIGYVKAEHGEESTEYFNAMVRYFDYIGDSHSLLNYLSSAIDDDPDDFLPYAYQLTADTYEKENQPELSLKYRKGYVAVSLRDSTSRVDKQYEILNAVDRIISYYVNLKKDTLAVYHYLKDELWPSLYACGDAYVDYFVRSINKLCFYVDDDSFIPFVKKEMKRRSRLFKSPIIQGCVDQAIAGVLSRGNDKEKAVEYMKQACKKVEKDSVLHLLFSCRLHEIEHYCTKFSNSSVIIQLGEKLIKQMEQKEEWKYTHEYVELIDRQLDLLFNERRYSEIVSVCQPFIKDFSQKNSRDLTHILNNSHADYESLDFLNYLLLNSWVSDEIVPTANKALYTALSIVNPKETGACALNLVHDSYKKIESGLDINYVSATRCDELISLTSKLAYKYHTDSLKMYAYDAALFCKGLQLRSDYAIRAIIQQSGHKSALRKYDELQYTLRLMENAPENRIDSLQDRVEKLERDLFRISEFFGDYKKSLYNSWKDVQQSLKVEDLAIEFTLVEKDYDDKYVIGDNSFQEGYYASVLRKGMSVPEIVFICETDSIDISPSVYSHTAMTRKLLGHLHQYMSGVRNIYFSPIGKLNQLSIEALPQLNDSTRTLSQMYNICRLSSTRELINNYHVMGTNAVVYGGLAYDASIDLMKTDADNYTHQRKRDIAIEDSVDMRGVRRVVADIPYLAGTKVEADQVAQTINFSNDTLLVAQTYEDVKGTEASFKSLDGKRKRIIHLATHGFYFNKAETDKVQSMIGQNIQSRREEDQSLMRSGLFMAGAENKYQGEILPAGVEDGILTAQEIANTDLSGLDLCVLSACQTAQGDISSEGVFGLQRGFKKAGAQSILMSLWKVDDEATCALMIAFYKSWIGEGKTKRDALEQAKQTVRAHKEKGWDDPRYWAAFIMLDALE